MPTTKLEDLLKKGATRSLQKIIQTAQDMDLLTGALQASAPQDLAAHILAANIRDDGELVVICSSSAWASRLRYEAEPLLDAARDAGFQATTMRVTVSRR